MGVAASQQGDSLGLVGTLLGGRFRVEERIAEGGFAIVYRGCQEALGRKVAIKVLKIAAGLDDAARARFHEGFATEAKTIARLQHPSIVLVYDFAISTMPSGGVAPWMALEWIDGETLEAEIDLRRTNEEGGVPARQSVEILRPVLEALSFAHRHGIAHRDVKPGNIMISRGPLGASTHLLDFGIAKIMQPDQDPGTGRTRTGSVPAFSPAYAAPEQVTFSRTGPWTDVHALGLILTELTTGKPPYGDQSLGVHEQVMATRRPTPREKGIDVGSYEEVIAKAVALHSGDRWRDAGDLLRALETAGGVAPSAIVLQPTRASTRGGAAASAPTIPMAEGVPRRPGSGRRIGVVVAGVAVAAALTALVGIGRARRSQPDMRIGSQRPAPAAVHTTPPSSIQTRELSPPAGTAESPFANPPRPAQADKTSAARPASAAIRRKSEAAPRRPTATKDLFDDIN